MPIILRKLKNKAKGLLFFWKGWVQSRRDTEDRARALYLAYRKRLPLDSKAIFLESQHGKQFSGNIYYMLRHMALSPDYAGYHFYLSAIRESVAQSYEAQIRQMGLRNVQVVTFCTEPYFRALATAKFLINDVTFTPFFLKREGQVYLNTWHGTPLKTLGKDIVHEEANFGNVQRNFLCADYMLFPNDYTKEIMIDAHMLDNFSGGQYILGGYPRNAVFYEHERRRQLRSQFPEKRIYAYMPTFRGGPRRIGTRENDAYLSYYLYEIDRQLEEDEVFYVNLHPIAKKNVHFEGFQHIKPFPAGWETYEFLGVADVLITDYSSVFFDFACTRRKIVLFEYDAEEYFSERGVYMSPRALPFPIVADVPELLREMRSEKQYDEAFLQTYCPHEGKDATRALCDFFVLGRQENLIASKIPDNGKENVLIYVENLEPNEMTASLWALLSNIDLTKRNYLLTCPRDSVGSNAKKLLELPQGVRFYTSVNSPNPTRREAVLGKLFKRGLLDAELYLKWQRSCVKEAFDREYGSMRLDHVVHYSGDGEDAILQLGIFDKNRILYVHRGRPEKRTSQRFARRDVLRHACRTYDHVAADAQESQEGIRAISGKDEKLSVVRVFFDHRGAQEKAKLPLQFDPDTTSTITEAALKEKLASQSKKFVSVGCWAHDKGRLQLIEAFRRFLERNPESELILIGENAAANEDGVSRDDVERLEIGGRVTRIGCLSNPFPIIKRCDGFVLSSEYDGFGWGLLAAALGVPVISIDVPGPRGMLKEFGGTLVENSVDGLYGGMVALSEGRVAPMAIDFEKYNEEANRRFEALFTTPKN